MKIVTTPMCEDVLKIAGVNDYAVVKPDNIEEGDVAVLLSETKSSIPKISVKLNSFTQLYESVVKISEKFNSTADEEELLKIKNHISENNEKKDNRRSTKVKVYSNFLKDTVLDMGYDVVEDDYDFIVTPDYINLDLKANEEVVVVPSHKNVPKGIIERINERYMLLEDKLCMKR